MRVRELLFIGAAIAAAQVPPAAGPPAAFRSGTRIVEVTLSATMPPRRFALRDQLHTPVNDLRAADVKLFDNGMQQTIASFEKIGGVVRGRNGVSVAGEEPEARRASVIILFDSLNTAQRDQFISHDEIRKLLLRLPPETRVALVGMDEYLRVFQDFSFDREALRAAIPKYERDYAFSAFSAGEVPYANLDPLARISKSVDALQQLARLAENVRGKKNVLWMSSGFPLNVLRGELMKAVRALVAANVALYPISPAGLLPDSTDNIVELAALTGGKAFYGSNDVARMAQAALKYTGDGYILTFVPTDYREDGSFHQLRVETSRPQVELHYRVGYVADPSK